MSPQLSKAVAETFVQLHSEGLIYRANKLVHWSCRLATALSTIEVNQKELDGSTKLDVPGYDRKIEFGTLTYFKYPIEGSDQTIEVATTRPETMLGDTGIAVHPQDDRYKDLIGKTARHPIIPRRKLIIITDDHVDREFGTGAVKLRPAHDHNDFTLGKKHGLPFINILNEDGTLNSNAGPYAGEKRFNARYGVIEELKKLGLYTRQESNKMVVPICSRSGDVIEPLLKPQWWMKVEPLTKPAIAVVESGELTIRPEMQSDSTCNGCETSRTGVYRDNCGGAIRYQHISSVLKVKRVGMTLMTTTGYRAEQNVRLRKRQNENSPARKSHPDKTRTCWIPGSALDFGRSVPLDGQTRRRISKTTFRIRLWRQVGTSYRSGSAA